MGAGCLGWKGWGTGCNRVMGMSWRVQWGDPDGVQGVNGVAGAQERGCAKDTGRAREVLGRVGLGAKAAPPRRDPRGGELGRGRPRAGAAAGRDLAETLPELVSAPDPTPSPDREPHGAIPLHGGGT